MHMYLSILRFSKHLQCPDMRLRLVHNYNYFHTSSPLIFFGEQVRKTIFFGFVFVANAITA